jgi:hypothetical protein
MIKLQTKYNIPTPTSTSFDCWFWGSLKVIVDILFNLNINLKLIYYPYKKNISYNYKLF